MKVVIDRIREYLEDNYQINDHSVSIRYKRTIEEISCLLIANTNVDNNDVFSTSEYDNVTSTFPQISKQLLVQIIIGTNLCPYFCINLAKMPPELVEELLTEIRPYVKKKDYKVVINWTYFLINCAIIKLNLLDLGDMKVSYSF